MSQIPALEALVGLAQSIGLQKNLDLPGAIGELREAGAAHDALQHHAPAHMHGRRMGLEPFGALLSEAHLQLRRQSVATEIIRIGAAREAQRGKLHAPGGDQLVFIIGRLFVFHAPSLHWLIALLSTTLP